MTNITPIIVIIIIIIIRYKAQDLFSLFFHVVFRVFLNTHTRVLTLHHYHHVSEWIMPDHLTTK